MTAEPPDKNCRICYESTDTGSLISPCQCSGSLKWIHRDCLSSWIITSKRTDCPQCRFEYCSTYSKPVTINKSNTWLKSVFIYLSSFCTTLLLSTFLGGLLMSGVLWNVWVIMALGVLWFITLLPLIYKWRLIRNGYRWANQLVPVELEISYICGYSAKNLLWWLALVSHMAVSSYSDSVEHNDETEWERYIAGIRNQ